jgi:hypothetical protein
VQPSGTKVCPDCAETVLADARVCRFCRHEFAASLEQERGPADLNAAGVQAVHEGASSAGPAFAAPDEQRLASDAERTSVPRKHLVGLRALAALIAIASTIVLVVALSGFGRSKTGEPVESHPAIAAATASTTPTTVAPTLQRAAVQHNGIEQSAYADFAPPLPVMFDLAGRGPITYLPSGVLRFVWENGTRTFIATKVPTYGGAIIYSHPDTDGHTPLYTTTYPWDPAQDIDSKFVDPLTYVGLGEVPKSLPTGARLLSFLMTVLVQPAGQGLFSYEGHDFVCTWTNGATIPPAAYGVVRDNVHVECAEN